MSEAERILAHIEAGHSEVYPFCGACRQSEDGAESSGDGSRSRDGIAIHSAPSCKGGARIDAPITYTISQTVLKSRHD